MYAFTRRLAAVAALTSAPALIALGAATASQAQSTSANTGPSTSHHHASPHQDNFPQPGSRIHHHHQWHHHAE